MAFAIHKKKKIQPHHVMGNSILYLLARLNFFEFHRFESDVSFLDSSFISHDVGESCMPYEAN